KGWNSFGLQDKLDELLRSHASILSRGRLGLTFADDFVKTRNHYVHPSSGKSPKAKEGKDLVKLISRTQYIIELLLLREIGVADDDIRAIVSNQRQWSRWDWD
ncbi:MAG TPA: HEPN domain-containing protein, partial [Gemmatimonadales bacterium]|nr:HEPN domain-containing protein [Gemmatimonadales bacterium]